MIEIIIAFFRILNIQNYILLEKDLTKTLYINREGYIKNPNTYNSHIKDYTNGQLYGGNKILMRKLHHSYSEHSSRANI